MAISLQDIVNFAFQFISSFLAETMFSILKERRFYQAHSEVAGVLTKARTRLMVPLTEQCGVEASDGGQVLILPMKTRLRIMGR